MLNGGMLTCLLQVKHSGRSVKWVLKANAKLAITERFSDLHSIGHYIIFLPNTPCLLGTDEKPWRIFLSMSFADFANEFFYCVKIFISYAVFYFAYFVFCHNSSLLLAERTEKEMF